MEQHLVKCRQCKKTFDRNTTDFIQFPDRFYYHTDCFMEKFPGGLEEAQSKQKKKTTVTKSTEEKTVTESKSLKANLKICYYCKKELDITKEDWVKPTINRYAHKACHEQNHKEGDCSSDDIYFYLKEKIHMVINYDMFEKQRASYVLKQGFTNQGIFNALKYWYEIKGNSIDKANGGIGIVPFIYMDAQHYFEELGKKQKAIDKSLQKGLKQEHIQVNIVLPETVQKRKTINLDDIFKESEEEDW